MTHKQSLVYLLHSGQLFGTERMALATLQALRYEYQPVLIAPPGPVHALARELGLSSRVFSSPPQLLHALLAQLLRDPHSVLLSTSVLQTLLGRLLQRLLRGRGAHLHIVHGGTDEYRSYGRKRWLLPFKVGLVAVSDFVAERLHAHGVPAERVAVIANFLPDRAPERRAAFVTDGVNRVVMLSRVDRIKRVGLLLDALDATPALNRMRFDIYGSGEELELLRQRARAHPNVCFHGFVPSAASTLKDADLLLHTCPEEPFGLVLLEAFAAGVPVLVPNAGGAAALVQAEMGGWHFSANDARALGRRLLEISQAPAAVLNACAAQARARLERDFHPARQTARYAALARGAI